VDDDTRNAHNRRYSSRRFNLPVSVSPQPLHTPFPSRVRQAVVPVGVTGRRILVTAVLALTLALAGCSTSATYETSVGEPTTGAVIENASITDVNELDGVQYRFEYSLTGSDLAPNATYSVEEYERTNGSFERVGVADLEPRESVHQNSVSPPWDAGDERTYEVRIVHPENDTVVDAVRMTIERTDG
jgi:hypothetical protein